MPNLASLSRQVIRDEYRSKRNALSREQQTHAAKKLLDTCIHSSCLPEVETIACYLANDGEIATDSIIEYCWQLNKRVLLPVLHPFCKGHLIFVEYCQETPMKANTYGILEPVVTCHNIFPLRRIDLIFLPLVAFDKTGNRLGMGGGYYDRTLAPIRREALSTQLIGLAHSCQLSQNLPHDSWDIPVNGIATPKQFFEISE